MNIKHHGCLTHSEFIRLYEHECKTPLELAMFDRLNHPCKYTVAEDTEEDTDSAADVKLSDALSALEDIRDITRGF